MTNRSMKLLGATTALVAAFASTPHAATIIYGTSGTAITTSGTTGVTVSGTGVISTTNAGIIVSSSATADNAIQVNTGGIIRANGNSYDAVISSTNVPAADNAAVVVNNSGTIAALGTMTKAIDLSSGTTTNGVTIRNTGTISGSITTGAGTDVLTTENGTINGAIDLGNGTNTLTVSNSSVNGNVTLGTGANTVTINNGSVVSSTVTFGDGGNVVTVNGATLKRSNAVADVLAFGTGADQLTVSNSGVISGTIAFGAGNDAMFAYGTYSTGGNITGLEQLQVSGTTNINHTVGAAMTALKVASHTTVNVNETLDLNGAASAVTYGGVDSVVNIASNKRLSAVTIGDGGKYILNLGNSSTIGRISQTTGGATLTNTSYTINVAANAGFIASGTQFIIVDNAGAGTGTGALTVSRTGVYRYSLDTTSNDVRLTIGRVSNSSVVTGETYQTIGNVLDNLGYNSSNTLITVQTVIGQQANAAGVQNVIESLAPTNLDGLGAAGVGFSTQTGNLVSNRLASLRSGSALSGVATGDAADVNHMWVEGFGSHVSQDDRKGQRGYDSNGGGASFGLDSDQLIDGVTVGGAFSYGKGSVESNASGGGKTDIDTYGATLYGSHVLGDGTFINGQLGAGYNKYDSTRNVAGVGTAKGDFNGWQATAKAEAGKDFAVSGFTLTPLASLQGTYLNVEDYTETGAGGANLHVDPKSLSALDAGLGGQAAYAMPLENGSVLKPTARAKYIYRMGDTNMQSTSNFTGGGASFATNGVKADRGSVNLGAGLLLTTAGGLDFSLNYDADIRSSLTGHTGQVKARWAF